MGALVKKETERLLRRQKRLKRWLALFLCLALLVTSGVFTALRMDGQAMDSDGQTEKTLNCVLNLHTHGDECYDAQGNLVCQIEETRVAHTHDDNCYDSEGNLVCTLPEEPPHIHDDSCYIENQELICGQEEGGEHQHTDQCYDTRKELVCNKLEVHTHGEECYDENGVLTCGLLELEEHEHGPECFEDKQEVEQPEQPQNEENGSVELEGPEATDFQDEETNSAPNEIISGDVVSDDTLSGNDVSGTAVSDNSVSDGETGDGSGPVRKKKKGSGRNTASVNTPSENAASGNTVSENGIAIVTAIENIGQKDGTAPFDDNNKAGNDQNDRNSIVRTFDTVTYTYRVTMASRDNRTLLKDACINLKVDLPATEKQAEFDLDAMPLLEDKKVEEKTDENGKPHQILTGKTHLSDKERYVVPGNYQDNVIIKIKDMKDGETLEPIFSAAMEKNAENEWKKVSPGKLRVSAAPKYNVQVRDAHGYTSTFDFNSGTMGKAANFGKGPFAGRAMKLGIALQLYNDSESKGLKGIELPDPDEDIQFDLDISSSYTVSRPADDKGYWNGQEVEVASMGYMPLLWSFDGSADFGDGGSDQYGRVLNDYDWSRRLVPDNTGGGENACYKGGSWQAEQNGSKITVTVSGWEIDTDQMPTRNGSGTDGRYGINVGCFSAGEFVLIQPFNKEGSSSLSPNYDIVQEIGEGNFHPRIEAKNLRVGGESFNSQNDEDKNVEQTFGLTLPGIMTNNVGYTKTGEDGRWTSPGFTEDGHVGYGDAYTLAGEEFNLAGGFSYIAGDDYGVLGWGSTLMKFEGEKLELISEGENRGITSYFANGASLDQNGMMLGENTFVFYATKSDGRKWKDLTEMQNTLEDELIFYKSLDDIPKGHVCVGMLVCFKGPGASGQVGTGAPIYQIAQKAKASKDHIGETCVLISTSRVWPKKTLEEAGINLNDIQFKYTIGDGGIETLQNMYTYKYDHAWGTPPSDKGFKEEEVDYNDKDHWRISWFEKDKGLNVKLPGKYLRSANIPGYSYIGDYDRENILNTAGSFGEFTGSRYQETQYKDGGGIEYQRTHNSTYLQWGDTLLILGYKANITKTLMQTDTTGQTKTSFSLNKDQRIVDYKLQPSTERRGEAAVGQKTTVTVVDTLPKYMTYVPNSAETGGKYVQTSPDGGEQGKIVDAEDKMEPEVVNNADGTQTLTWTISNVTIGEEMDPIYYSVKLGDQDDSSKEIMENMQLKNTVYITAEGDKRVPSKENGKLAEVQIDALRAKQTSYGKTVKQKVVEEDGTIDYTIYYNNFLESPQDALVVDTMPAIGVNESQFDGKYRVVGCELDERNKKNSAAIQVYYNTNSDGYTAVKEDIQNEKDGWTLTTIDTDGKIDLSGLGELGEHPASWAILAKVSPSQSIRINLQIKLNPGTAKTLDDVTNYFVNAVRGANPGEGKIEVSTRTARRVLEGLAWMDYDHDGLQNENATSRLSGVKVELLKLNEGGDPDKADSYAAVKYSDTDIPVVIETGQQVSVRASMEKVESYEPGRYRFMDLAPGTYAVRFADGTGTTKITQLKPTECKVKGGSEDINSDGQPFNDNNGNFAGTIITDIAMPTLDEIDNTGIYRSEHNDSGFYPPQELRIVKMGKGTETEIPLKNAKFTLSAYTENEDGTGTADREALYYGTSIEEGVVQWTDRNEKVLSALPTGTYLMKEVEAPENYLMNTEEWIIKIAEDGFILVTDKNGNFIEFDTENVNNEDEKLVRVVYKYTFYNVLYYKLPSTGGAGIYWYTIGGMLLMMGASLILYKNRRKQAVRR